MVKAPRRFDGLIVFGVWVIFLAVFAMALSSCGADATQDKPAQEIGKFIGFIPGHKGEWGVSVYEHEGNTIYVYRSNGIAVVPKRSEK